MNTKKLTQLTTIGIVVTFITIFHPFITFALTTKEIGAIATEITVRLSGPDQGSGVIINKNGNTYTVLTNSHVFEYEGAFEIITYDGKKYQLNNVTEIPNLDLATVQFNSDQKYRVVALGDSSTVTIGQQIHVSGFPSKQDLTFRSDAISRILKKPKHGGYTLVYRIGGIRGMSGGPILDESGKLVGIHGLTYSQSTGDGRGTPEEYGIPLQAYLNASSPESLSQAKSTPTRYAKLESLLQTQDFRAADQETDKVMLVIANRQREGWLRIEDVEEFPCKELRSIDKLWLKHTRGKFGISIQQQIYQSLGGTKEFNYGLWDSMGDRVGWRRGGDWLTYNNLNFSPSAKTGHLPAIGGLVGYGFLGPRFIFSLLSRYAECNT